MNILHVIDSLDPSIGGPPRVAVRLAAGQAQLGHEVTIAVARANENEGGYRQMVERLPAYDRVRITTMPTPTNAFERVIGRNVRRSIAPLVGMADVVHVHNVWETIGRVAASEARRAGKPYFVQPNDMLNPWSLGQSKWKKRAALAAGYRAMIDGASALLFGHPEERDLCRQSKFAAPHVALPLGGIFVQEVEPPPAAGRFRSAHPDVSDAPFVMFLSRLHFKKGLDYLAEGFAVAARNVPGAHLVVAGHDEGAKADFEQRIAKHGLQSRVHLVGPMHGDDKWSAYRDAACFCLPSRDEAYTVAINEALAAGLPVVISKTCHFPDVDELGAGESVDLTPDAIGGAMTRYLTDDAARTAAAAGAKRLFHERLSFDVAARRSIEIYEQAQRGPLAGD